MRVLRDDLVTDRVAHDFQPSQKVKTTERPEVGIALSVSHSSPYPTFTPQATSVGKGKGRAKPLGKRPSGADATAEPEPTSKAKDKAKAASEPEPDRKEKVKVIAKLALVRKEKRDEEPAHKSTATLNSQGSARPRMTVVVGVPPRKRLLADPKMLQSSAQPQREKMAEVVQGTEDLVSIHWGVSGLNRVFFWLVVDSYCKALLTDQDAEGEDDDEVRAIVSVRTVGNLVILNPGRILI